jgi:hypothetical protein
MEKFKKIKKKKRKYFAYLTGAGSALSLLEPKIFDAMFFFLLAFDCSDSDVPKILLLWPPDDAWALKKDEDVEKIKNKEVHILNGCMIFWRIRHDEWEFFVFILTKNEMVLLLDTIEDK